jgi:arginase family enzyme
MLFAESAANKHNTMRQSRGQDFPPTTGRQRNAALRRHRHHAAPAPANGQGLDAAFIGVPLDIGTSLRSGTRFGPRQIRAESVMIRPYNMATGAAPFDSLSVADIGDVAINTFNLLDAVRIIEEAYDEILEHNVIP